MGTILGIKNDDDESEDIRPFFIGSVDNPPRQPQHDDTWYNSETQEIFVYDAENRKWVFKCKL